MRVRSPSRIAWQAFSALAVVTAAALPLDAQTLAIRLYTTVDGLAHDTVFKIVCDSRGFIWFGTFDGLSRFDGYGMTTYGMADGLPGQVVRDLLETRGGDYWVATDAGLARFNPDGAYRRGPTTAGDQRAGPAMFEAVFPREGDRGSRVVTSLLEDRTGTIWCGTLGGLYRLERREGSPTLHRVAGIRRITSMVEGRRGNLWIAAADGLYRLDADGRTDRFSVDHGLPSDNIQSLMQDRGGHLWVGTSPANLARLVLDPDVNKPIVARVYSMTNGVGAHSINALLETSDDTVWAATDKGLISFSVSSDGHEFQMRAYTEADGIEYPFVRTLATDRNGHLWLGTSGGVARIARAEITTYTATEGLAGTTAMLEDGDGLLVVHGPSSKHVVHRFNHGHFTNSGPRWAEVAAQHVWRANRAVLRDSAGEWWVGTSHGVYRFSEANSIERVLHAQPTMRYTSGHGLASDNILALFEDSRGDIWIGSDGGLSRWDRASGAVRPFNEQDGWHWRFNPLSFAEDRAGNVWIGLSIGGGVVRYRNGRFTRFSQPDRVAAGGILHLHVDDAGRVWVPHSPGGVSRIDHPDAELPAIAGYTTAEGLAGNDVEAVTEDRQGRVYLASGRGIDRVDPSGGYIRHYTASEGTLKAGVNGALRDREGTLWFRYDTGIVRLVPRAEPVTIPPRVIITSIRIDGQPQAVSALGEVEPRSRVLPARSSALQIDFVALGLSPGDGSRYEFRLDGASELWSSIGEQRIVTLPHLAPGRYRFHVRAVSADGTFSDRAASFAFTVSPPVWQRWWFVTASVLALLLAAHAVQRYRAQRLIELERVRTRIAADLHDDIGASLSQIAVLSEVLRTQLGVQAPRVTRNISLINRTSQEALDSMSDIVWAINPAQDRFSTLVRRMRRTASEMLGARGIEFTFNAPLTAHDLPVGADMRRQVFLIFKETVNNIVRHSACSAVEISLTVDGRWISMVVADNGRGFDPDRATEGNGLAGLRRRAASLGGEAVVSSRRGEGTTITVTIPRRRRYFGPREGTTS